MCGLIFSAPFVCSVSHSEKNFYIHHSLIFSIEGRAWQEPEPCHVTDMALAHCILGKFLGVVCHCFPPPLDFPTTAARCLRPQFLCIIINLRGPGSSVGIATDYGLDGPGSIPGGNEIFRTCPYRPWGPPSLLCNVYRVFPVGRGGRGVGLTPNPI